MNSDREFTRQGLIRLGALIQQAIDDRGLSQKGLAEELKKLGYPARPDELSRVLRGQIDKPNAALLWAIADLKLLKHDSGPPYSLENLLEIACGKEPTVTLAEASGMYRVQPKFADAVTLLRQIIGDRTVEQAAHDAALEPEELEELLKGQEVPTHYQFALLTGLFPGHNIRPLMALYGISPDDRPSSTHNNGSKPKSARG
ncbi:hypothetical protein ACQ4M4_12770 [Leptolyngbya sp. AN02str]|uniref:hypothetical protein n=1 Tax=Leptolyngbya sp. AN02str TaxID=3423363 RepID=UPI003D3181F6